MTSDPFEAFKASQRQVWKSFAPLAQSTTPSAARLVHFAGVRPWPPELLFGRVFALVARYMPPPADPKPAPPSQWGDPTIVLQRLGSAVRDVTFDRGVQVTSALSPQHYRHMIEQSGGPIVRLLQSPKDDPTRLARFRRQYDEVVLQYFDFNVVRHVFLEARVF